MIRWTQDAWYGGNAADQFLGIPKSFQSGKNIEIRQKPRVIQLAKKPVRTSSGVIADWIMAFVTIQSTGDVIAFGDTGKVYRQVAGSGNFVLCYTDTSNRKILDAYEYNSYLYWATATKLHRIAVANIDNSWAGDVTEDYKTFTNGNTTHHPMLEKFNKLYIGDGAALAELDSFGVFTGAKVTIFSDEKIVGLSFKGSVMRMYSQRTTSVEYGQCYFWNGTSSTYSENIPWDGKTIHAVVTKNNNDYVLAGRKPSLYFANGYDIQHLTELPDFVDGDNATFNHNTLKVNGDLILFGAVEAGTNSINRGVWSFGAKNKDFPQVLNNDYTTTNGSASDLVGAIHVSNGKVYIAWKNGATYGLDVVDNTLYAATGEVVSRVHDGGAGEQKKELRGLKLGFKQLAAGEKIEVFFRRDLTSSWGSAVLTADYDNNTADRSINYKELGTNDLGDPFNFLETKIVLTAGTGQATTPIVTNLIVESDYIEVQ